MTLRRMRSAMASSALSRCMKQRSRFGLDGSLELADSGVTESIVIPWAMYGLGFDCDLEAKKDAVRRFSEEVICKF